MEWSKDMTSRLIELFRGKRVLWDPVDMDFKDRNKKHDSWVELGVDMEMDPHEIEKKIRMLIGQFQREVKKGKSGDGADAPFKSKWIFFKMLLFLKYKNEPRESREAGFPQKPSDQDIVQSQDTDNKLSMESGGHSLNESDLKVEGNKGVNSQQKTVDRHIPQTSTSKGTKRKAETMAEEAYAVMKQLSSNMKTRDEFDVFGEHVAHSLRNLNCRSSQNHAKFQISKILYRAEMDDQQPSYSTPRMTSNHHTAHLVSARSTPIPNDATSVFLIRNK